MNIIRKRIRVRNSLYYENNYKEVVVMDNNLKMHVNIKVNDDKEQMKIGNFIHEQLRGNKDYQNSNIVLNIDEPNEVNLYVFNECEEIPTIQI